MSSKPIEDKIVSLKMDISDLRSKVGETVKIFSTLNGALTSTKTIDTRGSIKNLTDLQVASEKVDFGALARNVDNISSKFSIMGIAGFNAINRIINSIFGLSAGFSNTFLTGPIKQGFDEYELKMGSIQTILANTSKHGTNLEQVSAALENLNDYADQTIYSFSDMTRSIGLFTNAGLGLNESTMMIKGFSNEAAASGVTSSAAAGAAYQLSQALSTGIVRAQDWNSLASAQMGNQNMKDGLIAIAGAMGVLNEKSMTAEEIQNDFKGSLENGWLTADVMSKYLQIMTGDMTDAEIAAIGLDDATVEMFKKQAAMALDAATKVRTFTQLIGGIKEQLGSGWAQTWELIFGDFNVATELWTGISDIIGAFIIQTNNARNAAVKVFRDLGGFTALLKSAQNIFLGLVSILTAVKEAFKEVFPKSGVDNIAQLAHSIEWLSGHIGYLLEGIGMLLKPLSTLFFGILKVGIGIIAGVAAVLIQLMPRNLIWAVGEIARGLSAILTTFGKVGIALAEALGFSDGLGKTGDAIINWAIAIREWLQIGIEWVGQFAGGGIEWLEKMTPVWEESMGKMVESIREFVDGVVKNLEPTMKVLSDAFGKAKDALSEFFGATSELFTAWWPLIVEALGIASKWFKNLYDDSKKYFVKAGEIIVEWLQVPLEIIADLATKAADAMKGFAERSNEKMTTLKETVTTTTEVISGFFSVIGEKAAAAGNWLWDHFGAVWLLLKEVVLTVWDIFRELTFEDIFKGGAIAGFIIFGKKIAGIFDAIRDKILGVAKPGSEQTDALKSVAKSLKNFVESIKPASVLAIAASIGILVLSIKLLEGIDERDISKGLAAIITGMSGMFFLMKSLTALDFSLGDALNIALMMAGLGAATLIMAGALKLLSTIDPGAMMSAVAAMVTMVIALTGAINSMASSPTGVATSAGFVLALAVAVRIMAGALDNLAEIDSIKLLTAVAALGSVIFAIAAFLENTKSAALGIGTGVALVVTAGAIMLIVAAIKQMSGIDAGELLKGLGVVIAVLAGFSGMAYVMKGTDLLRSGIGIAMIALAVGLLVAPLKALGEMDWKTLGVGMLAVAVGVMVLAQAAWMAGGMGGAGILLTAVALNLLIAPIAILGSMDLKTLAIGILALAAALGVIALIAWGLTAATVSVLAFGAGIALVGLGIGLVGGALLAFALGLSVLATVAVSSVAGILAVIGTFLYGLLQLVPLAMELVAAIFEAIAAQFEAFLPELMELGFRIIIAILTGIRNHIFEITTLVIEILVQFALALAENMDILVFAAAILMIQFIDTLANTIRTYGPVFGNAVMGLLESVIEIFVLALIDITRLFLSWIPGIGAAAENLGNTVTEKLREAFKVGDVADEKLREYNEKLSSGGSGARSGGGVIADETMAPIKGMDMGGEASTQSNAYASSILDGLIPAQANASLLGGTTMDTLSSFDMSAPSTEGMQQYTDAIMAGVDPAEAAALYLGTATTDALSGTDATTPGNEVVDEFIAPISAGEQRAYDAANSVGTSAEEGFGAPDFKTQSSINMDEVIDGISSKTDEIKTKSTEAGEAGKEAIGAVSYTDPGKEAGAEYSGGMNSQSANVSSTGTSIGSSGRDGAGSVSFSGTGYNAGAGFAAGIASSSNVVAVAGSNLGLLARAYLQKSILIASPSRALKEDGGFFGQGFANGISGQTSNVVERAVELAKGARDAVTSYAKSFSEKMLENMELNPVITPVMDLSNVTGTDLSGNVNVGNLRGTANMNVEGIRSPQQASVTNSTVYEIHITANGDLPQSTIKQMAQSIQAEIKNQNDRMRISRGEAVLF